MGGVDTHSETHHAAVLDALGRVLGDREFPATTAGYRRCWAGCAASGSWRWSGWKAPAPTAPAWPASCAPPGSRWSRSTGRTGGPAAARGKSDPIDAEAAARAVLAGAPHGGAEGRRRDRGGDPGAAGGPPGRGQGPHRRRSTSSRRCWSPPRPRSASRCAGLTHGGADPGVPGAAPDRPVADPAQAVRLVLRTARPALPVPEHRDPPGRRRTRAPSSRPPPRACSTRHGVGAEVTGAAADHRRGQPRPAAPAKPPSPSCAASPRSRPPAARPAATGSTAAATARPTARSTPSCIARLRLRPAHPRLRRPPHRRRLSPRERSSAASSATSPASSTTPWSHSRLPRRPGRLIDCRGWVNPETPKARAAGLKQPLQSMTIDARRGHHPETLDTDIGASWRSPTARRPGGSPRRNRRPGLVQLCPRAACGSPMTVVRWVSWRT